jgi:hypothetical protein
MFQVGDEKFLYVAEAEAIFPVHISGIGLNLSCLLDDTIHVPVFGGEDAGVVELDAGPQADTVLHHG